MPWTPRPTMNIPMLRAAPAISRPVPNAAIPVNSGPSGPRRSLHSPASAIANRLAVKNAEKPKAYSPMPSSARAATGIAVFTALASKATSETTEMMPRVSARYARPRMPPSGPPPPPLSLSLSLSLSSVAWVGWPGVAVVSAPDAAVVSATPDAAGVTAPGAASVPSAVPTPRPAPSPGPRWGPVPVPVPMPAPVPLPVPVPAPVPTPVPMSCERSAVIGPP